MPILIKDYVWKQTETIVIIQVPLNGVHRSKADIFTFDNYIKANFSPFIFEVFLHARIQESQSRCTLTEKEIVFKLPKVEHGLWEKLEASLSKTEKKDLRQQLLTKCQEKAKEEKEKKEEAKAEIKRAAIREQLALDNKEREHIKQIKETEKVNVMHELEIWRQEQPECRKELTSDCMIEEIPQENEHVKNSTNTREIKGDNKSLMRKSSTGKKSMACEKKDSTFGTKDIFKSDCFNDYPVPLPRNIGHISITFTKREFPTPSRESLQAEEEEWLKKQAQARQAVGFVAEDLKPEECNPIWLKDKGDSFFEMGNYLGAISAYSHAIKIGSSLPSLYSNRAAAHLAVGNFYRAHEDSTKALELLTPCISLNAKSRALCYVRRATALVHLGAPQDALRDLKAAETLEPNDLKLKEDIQKVQVLVENQGSSEEDN